MDYASPPQRSSWLGCYSELLAASSGHDFPSRRCPTDPPGLDHLRSGSVLCITRLELRLLMLCTQHRPHLVQSTPQSDYLGDNQGQRGERYTGTSYVHVSPQERSIWAAFESRRSTSGAELTTEFSENWYCVWSRLLSGSDPTALLRGLCLLRISYRLLRSFVAEDICAPFGILPALSEA